MIITNYFTYDAFGLITSVGTGEQQYLASCGSNGDTVVNGVADQRTQYVLNNVLCNYTPQELHAKNNLPGGWVWKMPERIAVDQRTAEQRKADNDQSILDARAAAYPKIADQLDALWKAMDAGILPIVPDFYNPIAAVKIAYPKN